MAFESQSAINFINYVDIINENRKIPVAVGSGQLSLLRLSLCLRAGTSAYI